MRFADEEDADDICVVVNAAYFIEQEQPGGFRKAGPKLTRERVEEDCSSMAARWIVLETASPEENVVGVLRLRMNTTAPNANNEPTPQRRAIIDIVCATGAIPAERTAICNQLLARVEGIAIGLGVEVLIIELTQWREDLQSWASSCGYEDRGGYMLEQENLLMPTMVLEFQKNVRDLDVTQQQRASLLSFNTTPSPSPFPSSNTKMSPSAVASTPTPTTPATTTTILITTTTSTTTTTTSLAPSMLLSLLAEGRKNHRSEGASDVEDNMEEEDEEDEDNLIEVEELSAPPLGFFLSGAKAGAGFGAMSDQMASARDLDRLNPMDRLNPNQDQAESMEALIATLFAALHKEEEEVQDKEVVEASAETVAAAGVGTDVDSLPPAPLAPAAAAAAAASED